MGAAWEVHINLKKNFFISMHLGGEANVFPLFLSHSIVLRPLTNNDKKTCSTLANSVSMNC